MSFLIYFGLLILTLLVLLKVYISFFVVKYCKSKTCLVGKTIIITGANAGIGYEAALNIATRGARVILACRSQKRGSAAVDEIIKLTQNKNVVLKILDLASIKSIKSFAKDIIENEKKLDVLINNAGILGCGDSLTEDGLQLVWQTNSFGPALLTFLLLDTLKKSAPSRIVNLTSGGAAISKLSLETFHKYGPHWGTYCNTKLANIFFTQGLAKKLEGTNVSVFSLHPGAVNTDIIPETMFGRFFKELVRIIVGNFYLNPEEGCQTIVYCACEQNIEHLSGYNFEYCKAVQPYGTAKNHILAKQIWDETMKIIKLDKAQ